jgi:hypothetical protein
LVDKCVADGQSQSIDGGDSQQTVGQVESLAPAKRTVVETHADSCIDDNEKDPFPDLWRFKSFLDFF